MHLAFTSPWGIAERCVERAHQSKLRGVNDSFRKRLGSFLGQVVPDTPRDGPMFVWAGEFLCVSTRVGMLGTIGIAFERNGGHGNCLPMCVLKAAL